MDMDINFGDEGDGLLEDEGDLAFGDDNNELLDDGGEDNGFNGIQVQDMEDEPYNNMGDDEQDALNAGKNSYLEMSKATSANPAGSGGV